MFVAGVHESLIGTFVWTGRALQAECDDLEMIGLALLYPALERSVCAPGHLYAKPRNECRLKSVKQTSPGGEQVARENYSYSRADSDQARS
jgi:hypothetical protein